LADAAARW